MMRMAAPMMMQPFQQFSPARTQLRPSLQPATMHTLPEEPATSSEAPEAPVIMEPPPGFASVLAKLTKV